MKQDNYLMNYYEKNNEIKKRINMKKKILLKTIILLICSLLYFIFLNLSNFSKFKGEINAINFLSFFEIIMNISLVFGVIGVTLIIGALISPNTFHKIDESLSYNIKKVIYTILDWFSIIPVCIVIAIFLFSYLFIITPVSGNSMYPNILDGERVLVEYNKKIDYGKVVVVEVNEEDSIYVGDTKYFIKRIIGMPGDSVKWVNNTLYINDKEYEESYFEKGYFDHMIFTNPFNGVFKYKDESGNIQTTLVIPEGYYFVMGDNRPISNDSRDIGLIKKDNIVGVATYHIKGIIPYQKIK